IPACTASVPGRQDGSACEVPCGSSPSSERSGVGWSVTRPSIAQRARQSLRPVSLAAQDAIDRAPVLVVGQRAGITKPAKPVQLVGDAATALDARGRGERVERLAVLAQALAD